METQSFFQNAIVNAISFGVGILGIIIGLFFGLITYKSYRKQKKLEYGYINVLEQATRDWKGKYTEEQIKDLAVQFKKLEAQIRNEIPQQARKTLLENQLNAICISIGELYSQYKIIKNQISQTSSSVLLDKSITGVIESDIMPIYTHKQKQNRNLYYLVLFILIFTVIPFILQVSYSFFDNLVLCFSMYILGLVFLIFIIKPFKLEKADSFLLKKKSINYTTFFLQVLIWIGIICFVIIEPNHLDTESEFILSIISYIPFSISLHLLYIHLNSIRAAKHKNVDA